MNGPAVSQKEWGLVFTCLAIFLAGTAFTSGCLISGPTSPPHELTGPEWHLVSLRGSDGSQVDPLQGTSIILKFDPSGQFEGISGCNIYTGSFAVEGELLTVSSIASTEMFCQEPSGVMEQESRYRSLLSDSTRYHFTGEYLVLSYYDEEKWLVFKR